VQLCRARVNIVEHNYVVGGREGGGIGMRFRPVTWHLAACDIWRPAVPRRDGKM
jgi:hypothetical protein